MSAVALGPKCRPLVYPLMGRYSLMVSDAARVGKQRAATDT